MLLKQNGSKQHSNSSLYSFREKSFSGKISLDISYESSARQTSHTKCQALFSLKNKQKYFKMLSARVVNGILRLIAACSDQLTD